VHLSIILTLISGTVILVSGFLSSIRVTRSFSPLLIAGLRYYRNTEKTAENTNPINQTMTVCFYKRRDTLQTKETLLQTPTDCHTASVTIIRAKELNCTKHKRSSANMKTTKTCTQPKKINVLSPLLLFSANFL